MKQIVITIALILISLSCVDNKTKPLSDNKKAKTNEPQKTGEAKSCAEKSKVLTDFLQLLEADNYNIDTTWMPDTLSFVKYKGLEKVGERYDFTQEQFTTFYAKRKKPLANMADNWYPNFRVFEICFADSLTAGEYKKKINKIISGNDLVNEKNYDYILQNSNRLIYVTCGAKIFEEYALTYKDALRELIKNE